MIPLENDTSNPAVGARMRLVRKLRKYSSSATARLLDISAASYSQYETGQHRPPNEVMRNFCIRLDVSADFILWGNLEAVRPQFRDMLAEALTEQNQSQEEGKLAG